MLPVSAKNNEIVTVTKVVLLAQPVLHEPIKLMQVNISKELAGEIAERNAFAWACREAVDYRLKQLKCICVSNFLLQQIHKNFVINRGKELLHITLEGVHRLGVVMASLSQEGSQTPNCRVSALFLAAGIAVIDKLAFEQRLNGTNQCLMNQAVLDGSLVDSTLFRIANSKRHIWAVFKLTSYQLLPQFEDVFL